MSLSLNLQKKHLAKFCAWETRAEKKIMITETDYTYKPLFKKVRYHSIKNEVKIEIDDQKIKAYGTNKSDWEWQYKVWEYNEFNYNDPKKLKKFTTISA